MQTSIKYLPRSRRTPTKPTYKDPQHKPWHHAWQSRASFEGPSIASCASPLQCSTQALAKQEGVQPGRRRHLLHPFGRKHCLGLCCRGLLIGLLVGLAWILPVLQRIGHCVDALHGRTLATLGVPPMNPENPNTQALKP